MDAMIWLALAESFPFAGTALSLPSIVYVGRRQIRVTSSTHQRIKLDQKHGNVLRAPQFAVAGMGREKRRRKGGLGGIDGCW